MAPINNSERKSKPLVTKIPTDPKKIAHIEARNALRQFDATVELITEGIQAGPDFKIRPSTILDLNRIAVEETIEHAGIFRPHPMTITNSPHEPPLPRDVPKLVEDLCDYVNDNWNKPAVHLAAYVMWRVNWIHPFMDGNGRTARAFSYAVLCIRLGYQLPGTLTIPRQIADEKGPYYDALEAADQAFENGDIDLGQMEKLLADKLAAQLLDVHDQATRSTD